MSNHADITAIRTHFLDVWGETTPVYFENEEITDQPTTAYVVLGVMPVKETRLTVGSTAEYERVGNIWADVYAPIEEGDAQSLMLTDQVASLFRDWRTADHRITCAQPTYRRAADDQKFMRMIVEVVYRSRF